MVTEVGGTFVRSSPSRRHTGWSSERPHQSWQAISRAARTAPRWGAPIARSAASIASNWSGARSSNASAQLANAASADSAVSPVTSDGAISPVPENPSCTTVSTTFVEPQIVPRLIVNG